MTTWREVHHQAERCRRLHAREQQLSAAKLLFHLLREQLGGGDHQAGAVRYVPDRADDALGARK